MLRWERRKASCRSCTRHGHCWGWADAQPQYFFRRGDSSQSSFPFPPSHMNQDSLTHSPFTYPPYLFLQDIMNTVVVLAKAAVKRDGEKHNAKVLQATLEEMHFQYTSLANECTCLQDRLRKEKVGHPAQEIWKHPPSPVKKLIIFLFLSLFALVRIRAVPSRKTWNVYRITLVNFNLKTTSWKDRWKAWSVRRGAKFATRPSAIVCWCLACTSCFARNV